VCTELILADAVSVKIIGMNAKLIRQYMEFVTDRLLVFLGVNVNDHLLQGKTHGFRKAGLGLLQVQSYPSLRNK
jgi:hypothetical protein